MPKVAVLVVEDDAAVRETLAEALALDGYDVRSVANGRDALRAIEQARPDAIVLDLMMPVMDGWEFRRLQREVHQDIPVLVLSAAGAPRLGDLRPEAYLTKPFDLDAFLAVMRGIVRRRGELAS